MVCSSYFITLHEDKKTETGKNKNKTTSKFKLSQEFYRALISIAFKFFSERLTVIQQSFWLSFPGVQKTKAVVL